MLWPQGQPDSRRPTSPELRHRHSHRTSACQRCWWMLVIPQPLQRQTVPVSLSSSSRTGPVDSVRSLRSVMEQPCRDGWEPWMAPTLSLGADLELRQAQLDVQRTMRQRPESLTGFLCSLMSSHVYQQAMLDGALARVIELRAQLAIAEMGVESLAQRYEELKAGGHVAGVDVR